MLSLDIIKEIFQRVSAHPENDSKPESKKQPVDRLPPHLVIGGIAYCVEHTKLMDRPFHDIFQRSVQAAGKANRGVDKDLPVVSPTRHFPQDRLCDWEPSQAFFRNLLKTCSQWKQFKLGYPSFTFPRALNSSELEPNLSALRVLSLTGRPQITVPSLEYLTLGYPSWY